MDNRAEGIIPQKKLLPVTLQINMVYPELLYYSSTKSFLCAYNFEKLRY
jgi:hypothetical protein